MGTHIKYKTHQPSQKEINFQRSELGESIAIIPIGEGDEGEEAQCHPALIIPTQWLKSSGRVLHLKLGFTVRTNIIT